MSTVTPLIDYVEDLWPADAAPDDVLEQLVEASHLLGANRAVANFGGGNTSAKGRATDHTGREIDVMWVKGSGSDLATMGREHFTALKLDEVLLDAYRSDVRPLCAQARAALGAAEDPVAAFRSGDWQARAIAQRGEDVAVAGGWGR